MIDINEKFRCPVREYTPNAISSYRPDEKLDKWFVRSNGDLVCSFCYSWHPEMFFKYCRDLIDDCCLFKTIQYSMNRGLIYVDQPGIKEEKNGARHVCEHHINHWFKEFDDRDIESYLIRLINQALKVSRRKLLTISLNIG